MTDYHQDYVDAAVERRWTGQLRFLFPTLVQEARAVRRGTWCWRVLPQGALVSLRLGADHGRWEVRISRNSPPPETEEAQARWEHEIRTFLRHFVIEECDGESEPATDNCGRFYVRIEPEPEDDNKTAARFVALRQGEIRPHVALCWDCFEEDVLEEVPWNVVAGHRGQLCPRHKMERAAETRRPAPEGVS